MASEIEAGVVALDDLNIREFRNLGYQAGWGIEDEYEVGMVMKAMGEEEFEVFSSHIGFRVDISY